jgi:3-phenylpropionate/cinnamic acid dioxygenase small subunit
MELLAPLQRFHGRKGLVTTEATQEVIVQSSTMVMPETGYPVLRGARVPVKDPRHWEIVDFLEGESALLDDNDFTSWLGLLAPEVVYRAPVRTTRDHRAPDMFDAESYHYNENIMTLSLKLMRLVQTNSAWSENPLSRTQRIIHKVRAYETDKADEYQAYSSIVLLRSRTDEPGLEILPARRLDTLRTTDWKLTSRTVYFDQTTLGVRNLAIYL